MLWAVDLRTQDSDTEERGGMYEDESDMEVCRLSCILCVCYGDIRIGVYS